MFNNKQKTILVFTMLGEVFSDNILKKLPSDVFEKVQDEILPYVGQIPLPDDIDSFVLDNILKDEDLLDIDLEEEELLPEKVVSILDLDGDEFFAKVELVYACRVLKQEKTIFQSFLVGFFNDDRKESLIEMLEKDGISIVKDFQKTAILEGIESKVKKEFIDKIKHLIKQANKA